MTVLGAVMILLPLRLIGTCMNPSMICNVLMKPSLLAAGILAIAASAVLVVVAREQEHRVTLAAA